MLTIFRPKRKRAYHRALKRQEPRAVWEKHLKDHLNLVSEIIYARSLEPSPFLKMMGLKESLDEKS